MEKHHHEHTTDVVNRLSRAIGHLQAVKRMVEEGEDCADVLIQLSAVRSAINNAGKVLLKDHIDHCIVEAARTSAYYALAPFIGVALSLIIFRQTPTPSFIAALIIMIAGTYLATIDSAQA